MSEKLKGRLDDSFFAANAVPNPYFSVCGPGPELVSDQVDAESLVRDCGPACQPRELPPCDADVPDASAVAAALGGAEVAGAGGPVELGYSGSLVLGVFVDGGGGGGSAGVESGGKGEYSDSLAATVGIVKTKIS